LFAIEDFKQRSDAASGKLIVYGAFGGRMDQTLSSVHELIWLTNLFRQQNLELELILCDMFSLMMLVEPGETIIYPSSKLEAQKGCGLIPVSGVVKKITTSGLKWELGGDSIELGVFISTSNEITGDSVKIVSSDPVIWVTSLNDEQSESE
jgi:thiamine pyrophosphokinase